MQESIMLPDAQAYNVYFLLFWKLFKQTFILFTLSTYVNLQKLVSQPKNETTNFQSLQELVSVLILLTGDTSSGASLYKGALQKID